MFNWSNFEYAGAFRLPNNPNVNGDFIGSYGGMGITPVGMLMQGKTDEGFLGYADITIPDINPDQAFDDLPVAQTGSFFGTEKYVDKHDEKKNRAINIHTGTGNTIGGFVYNYDATTNQEYFVFKNIEGLFRVQGDYRAMGWFSDVPVELQSELGYTHIMGGGHNFSIAARASIGPTAFGVNLSDVGLLDPIPTTAFMDYDNAAGHALFKTKFPALVEQYGYTDVHYNCVNEKLYPDTNMPNHISWPDQNPPLGNDIWINPTRVGYGFIVPGTRTYAVFGTICGIQHGCGYRILDSCGHQWPGPAPHNCQDWNHMIWLFDIDEFIAVKNGQKQPHEVLPYEYGPINIPLTVPDGIGLDNRNPIHGGTYDAQNEMLYLSLRAADNSKPVIVAFKVNVNT